MTLFDVIEQAKKVCGSIQGVADAMGVERQTVYKWRNGETFPTRDNEAKLYRLAGLSQSDVANVTVVSHTGPRKIPLIDQIKAGRGGIAVDAYPVGAAETFLDVAFDLPKGTIALRLHGDSMEPDYREGDIIFIDPGTRPSPGELVVVELFDEVKDPGHGEWTFKEYRPRGAIIDGFEVFDLVARNGQYRTITINRPGQGRLIGTMVGAQILRRR